MAHAAKHTHHESHAKRYLFVFLLLTVITTVEVVLGIIRPDFLAETNFFGMHLLNWIFIVLTLYKAYYIAWAFMHLENETKGLRRAIVWTALFLIGYLIFILLTEGDYIHEVLNHGYVTWDF